MNQDLLHLFSGIPDRAYAREGRCICEGRLVIEKALQNNIELEALLCSEERIEEYEALCRTYHGRIDESALKPVPILGLPHAEIEKLVGFDFHRGALAAARRPVLSPPRGALGENTLVLWQVSDPDNLGTLIRSASALGAGSVILGPGSADPFSRKALRTSMGCAFSMPIFSIQDTKELTACAVEAGASLTAACPVSGDEAAATTQSKANDANRQTKLKAEKASIDGSNNVPIAPDAIPRPLWLILGNEGWGLPDDLLDLVEYRVAIPMRNNTDSLNVAAAGAILMHELF